MIRRKLDANLQGNTLITNGSDGQMLQVYRPRRSWELREIEVSSTLLGALESVTRIDILVYSPKKLPERISNLTPHVTLTNPSTISLFQPHI